LEIDQLFIGVEATESIGGKGGTRTLDPGIMSAVCRGQVSDFSTFGRTAVAAKCLKVHRRARENPADLPRANLLCKRHTQRQQPVNTARQDVMKKILTIALVMVLASVAQAAAVDQLRLTAGEIAAKEAGGAGAGTSGVARIQTTLVIRPPKPTRYYGRKVALTSTK
jgi:hypothetical protein